jgi:hypothetical protein
MIEGSRHDDVGLTLAQFFTTEELVEMFRDNLRYARALPPGEQRNQHLKLAQTLKALFLSKNLRLDASLIAPPPVSSAPNKAD